MKQGMTSRKVGSVTMSSGRVVITVRERGSLGTTTVSLTRSELFRIVRHIPSMSHPSLLAGERGR
jgi:hypothetical protein